MAVAVADRVPMDPQRRDHNNPTGEHSSAAHASQHSSADQAARLDAARQGLVHLGCSRTGFHRERHFDER